jgi:coiled-coil domain-containing protein 40
LLNERKKLEHSKSKIEAQLNLLKSSIATTNSEIQKADIEEKQIEEQMNQIEGNIMKMHTETKALIEQMINNISEHKTIEKTAANLQKQAHLISAEIEEKEVELENTLNEIARVQIDKMNTESQIEQLREKKNEVQKEKEEKEITVATYEVQIRQGHDLNEKKQHEVGKLNKEHDEWKSKKSEGSGGSEEVKINNLKRECKEKEAVCDNIKREWIKSQTQLVNQSKKKSLRE